MVQKNPNQGRQKIAMKKIAKKNNLQVTFSKRRAGVFKKASELCTLCAVDVAIIVFSPAGKVFSFGHPQVDATIDRFLTRNLPPHNTNTHKLVEAHRNANIHELNAQLSQYLDMLEVEKRKGEALQEIREAGKRQCWWQGPIDELRLNELEQLRIALEDLKRNVMKQVSQVVFESSNCCWPFLAANGAMGGGFSPFGNNQVNEMNNDASCVTQMYKFGHGLF